MSIIKIVCGDYTNPESLNNLIHGYVFRKADLYGGLAVDPSHAAEQMLLVKKLWGKTQGQQLRHFILSFSDYESTRIQHAHHLQMIAYWVCEHYADEYQIVYGIHSFPRFHIHFVINSISYKTGGRFPRKRFQDFELQIVIESILSARVPIYYD